MLKFEGYVKVNVTGLLALLVNLTTVTSPEGDAAAVGSALTVTNTALEVLDELALSPP
jgi:hypothetical protein